MKKSSLTATIELTCVDLPEEPDEDEVERTEETLAMWRRAKKIADRFGVRTNFSEHRDRGTLYGDAYVYPSIDVLEDVLDAFDSSEVNYDNIDIEDGTSKKLVMRLKKRYPRGCGVMVND